MINKQLTISNEKREDRTKNATTCICRKEPDGALVMPAAKPFKEGKNHTDKTSLSSQSGEAVVVTGKKLHVSTIPP